MRTSAVAVLALLAAPLCLDAQLRPTRDRRPRPAIPAELPPAAPEVANYLAYKRSRLAIESYPLISIMHSPQLQPGSGRSVWAEAGAGTHVDYRLTYHLLATLDVTSAFWDGMARSQTFEVGTRFMPDRYESRTRPFADLRVGVIASFVPAVATATNPSPGVLGYATSGYGASAGAGLYHDLTSSWSLMTAGSIARGELEPVGPGATGPRVPATWYRLVLGVRYNRVRQVHSTPQPTR